MFEVTFVEEDWLQELAQFEKNTIKKGIINWIEKILFCVDLMKEHEFVWEMTVQSEIEDNRIGDDTYYNFIVNRVDPECIDIMRLGPKGDETIGILTIKVKKILLD